MIPKNNTTAEHRTRFINPSLYSGLGKLPPQAVDLEEAVLGALMLEKNALLSVIDMLKSEMFYRDAHQKIYSAITRLFERSSAIDILTITSELRKAGELEMIGGAFYITELTSRVASAANIEFHARIILQKFIQRELIRTSTDIINDAYEDTTDVLELLENAETAIFKLASDQQTKQPVKMELLVDRRIKEYHLPKENGLTGLSSGFAEIDKITGGWQKTDLIILAARPAMGKTALALQLAKFPAIDGKKAVAFFSLEMNENQLTDRLISSETGVFQEKLMRRELEEWDTALVHTKSAALRNAKIFIDDSAAVNILELRAKARRLKSKYDISLIVVDYLQLMHGKTEGRNSNREQEISTISRGLKALAKELNIPVIALSQLSRRVEERPGGQKRPMLSDLRESGSIEQDADVVLFLYRPEYYGITADENNESTIGRADVIFAKNRAGVCETVPLQFNGALMKFSNWTQKSFSF